MGNGLEFIVDGVDDVYAFIVGLSAVQNYKALRMRVR